MRRNAFLKVTLCSCLILATAAFAQPSGRGGLYGDWPIKVQFGERQMDSILSFSRDRRGGQTDRRALRGSRRVQGGGPARPADVQGGRALGTEVQVRRARDHV